MITALNINNKIFVVYIVPLTKRTIILTNSSCKVKVTLLTSMEIYIKYFDFLKIYSSDSLVELLEYIRINDHIINLLNDKQLFYGLIYSIELVELQILKIYIKTNLASDFIKSSKYPATTLILFLQKKNGSLHLYMDN